MTNRTQIAYRRSSPSEGFRWLKKAQTQWRRASVRAGLRHAKSKGKRLVDVTAT